MGSNNILKPQSTFLKAAPLINLINILKFFRECWESNQGQLGPEASFLNTAQIMAKWELNKNYAKIENMFLSDAMW